MPVIFEAPYGADAAQEVRDFFSATPEEFIDRARALLKTRYGLPEPVLERLHVANGFALTLTAQGRRLVFKFDAHDDAAALSAHLQRLDVLRLAGLPFPRIHPTVAGDRFVTAGDTAMRGYLMDVIPGRVTDRWSPAHAQATAEALARMHRLGAAQPVQPGERVTFEDFWPEVRRAVARLRAAGALAGTTLERARALVAAGPPADDLPCTHVHGDPRLCHFLFEGETLTGLIDHDAGGWGPRLGDLAYLLASHPDSATVAFLEPEQVRDWLERYDALSPLTPDERAAVPAALGAVLLVETEGALSNLESGRTRVRPEDVERGARLLDGELAAAPRFGRTGA